MVTFLGLLALLVMAVAILPVPRVRRLLLTATARLGQTALLTLVGACGTFFVQPDVAPGWLVSSLAPLLEGIRGLVPSLGSPSSGWPWLLLGCSVVLVALPVLIVLELVVGLSRQTSLVHTLRKELRLVAAWVDSRLFAIGVTDPLPPLSREARAAAEAFRTTKPNAGSPDAPSSPLVLDLMK